MKISYAIPVCNEHVELERLLSFLVKHIDENDEIVVQCDKGMVFPEPIKNADEAVKLQATDWGWTVVKAIPIPEEEQHKYPDPTNPGTNYKNKMDMKNMNRLDKLCFMDAAEELGLFAKPIEVNED